MAYTRFPLTVLVVALAVGPVLAGPGLFGNKPGPDAARVRTLVEALKNDPDERKRKAAATELSRADGRVIPEVAPALVVALQRDVSAAVRSAAADALGQLNQIAPMAGTALETAMAGDPSPAVRLAAKKALWEYHLNGYHRPKGTDGFAAQTVEPPIASPAGVRRVVAVEPAPPAPAYVAPLSAELPVRVSQLPQIAPPVGAGVVWPSRFGGPWPAPPVGPRVAWPARFGGLWPAPPAAPRTLAGATPPPVLNVTNEPPIAKPVAVSVPIDPTPAAVLPAPTVVVDPPAPVEPRVPDYVPTLPPFVPYLPSVVLPPDAPPLDPAALPPKIPATLPSLPPR